MKIESGGERGRGERGRKGVRGGGKGHSVVVAEALDSSSSEKVRDVGHSD